MAFTNQSPLVGASIFGNVNTQATNPISSQPMVSPQEWEYVQQIRRSGYDPNQIQQIQQQMNQSMQQSDPYTDFENEFSKCSTIVQNNILNDKEFQAVMQDCDRQIQRLVEELVRPQVMQTKEGRLSFERLLAVFREQRDKYTREEASNMERLQKLMNDDVIRKRMMEMEQGANASKSGGVDK